MKRSRKDKLLNVLWMGSAVLTVAVITARWLAQCMVRDLEIPLSHPSNDYGEALQHFAELQALDREDVNPVCCSQLLTHGSRVNHVIVLIHGITNCPEQFAELAALFFERGYNVLIPRMPHNGLANRMTDELKKLTAQELCDASNFYVDIAHGLGEQVTFLGLSAGGTMAAWVAQHRPDVYKAILVAPMLGVNCIGPRVTIFLMQLLLALPNISTQNFLPFRGGPTHSYLGYSSYALVEVMRLGAAIYLSSGKMQSAAQSILLITNANDTTVNNQITRRLVRKWHKQGLEHLEHYEFGKVHQLIHDLVDPQQQAQRTSFVYPILLDLATK